MGSQSSRVTSHSTNRSPAKDGRSGTAGPELDPLQRLQRWTGNRSVTALVIDAADAKPQAFDVAFPYPSRSNAPGKYSVFRNRGGKALDPALQASFERALG